MKFLVLRNVIEIVQEEGEDDVHVFCGDQDGNHFEVIMDASYVLEVYNEEGYEVVKKGAAPPPKKKSRLEEMRERLLKKDSVVDHPKVEEPEDIVHEQTVTRSEEELASEHIAAVKARSAGWQERLRRLATMPLPVLMRVRSQMTVEERTKLAQLRISTWGGGSANMPERMTADIKTFIDGKDTMSALFDGVAKFPTQALRGTPNPAYQGADFSQERVDPEVAVRAMNLRNRLAEERDKRLKESGG